MAELATGAVSTLLGVIGHEAARLGRVRRDVQFIKEEMESMGSFLANLSGNSREHDEQVRTWMNQVRILANDCNNCIDLYLYRNDPALHRPRARAGDPRRYFWWASWLLRKLLAQHRAAGQLRELKDRAQDIGNRRLRYGVEVKPAESSPSSGLGQLVEPSLLPATQDHDEEEDGDHQDGGDPPLKVVALSMTTMKMDKEDYFRRRLDHWIGTVVQAVAKPTAAESKPLLPSIAFVVTEIEDADALGSEALEVAKAYFKRAEDVQDKGVPPETKEACAPAHENKVVVLPETGVLAHEDKALPLDIEDAGALAHEDKSVVPPESKDVDALCPNIRQCHRRRRRSSLLCMKIRWLCHRRSRTLVPPETKDAGALVHEDKVVALPETKGDGGTLAHEDKADVPSETKGDGGPLAHEDKADVPPETKGDGGVLVHQDKAVVPAETKDPDAPVHEDKADAPEIKDAGNVVLVDVLAVHYGFLMLRPHKILCYILAEIKRQQGIDPPIHRTRWDTYQYRKEMIGGIKKKIKKMHVDRKIEAITIQDLEGGKGQLSELKKLDKAGKKLKEKIPGKSLDQLLWLLIYHSTSTAASEKDKKIKSMVAELYDDIIKQTAKDLKVKIEKEEEKLEHKEETSLEEEMEDKETELEEETEAGGSSSKLLQEHEYEDILREVFPSSTTTAANSTPRTLVDDIIKDMVKKEVKEMLQELPELDRSDKNRKAGSEAAQLTPKNDFVGTTKKKMKEIKMKITKQLKIKMVVQKIQECLRDDQRILVILKVYDKYVPQWEETRNILRLLGSECPITGVVIVAKRPKTTREDKKQYFGCPELELIEYSLVGLYFDTVLQVTSQHTNDHQVLRDILCECKQHEFCMKIFAHALYAKPKRSSEELRKLHNTLCDVTAQKSLPSMMFKFSYRDLPKEYRSCLLYLAIFPQGQTIKRSTLIGRWVAEGMITTKEWSWTSSVVEAEKCFDMLVARCLVCPAGIGATGKVNSCTVHKLIYGFITKIAKKQHILETRLSRHLARHFSIFSDVRLRSSEKIENFLGNIPKSSQFSKLKVLDLEGCHCFLQYPCYLRDICRKILMLKYLSLRGTDVTWLPGEINHLLELEVLDIRQTKIPAYATRKVLLRKLKRLLADHVDSADFSSVQIPEKIEKMEGVEVLSNVKPKNHRDLKNIAGLNQLKKLGVAIDKESDLQPLLDAISDLLKQSLCFLSITLDITRQKQHQKIITRDKVTPPKLQLGNNPKHLESLSINGSTITDEGQLLPLLTKNAKQLAKVTLTDTSLSQKDLQILAKLESLRCVKFRHSKYTGSKLTFNKGEFKNLNNLLVEGNNMTEIIFDNGAATNLERIVLSSTNTVSISGVDCLKKLEELELNNITNKVMLHSLLVNAKHITRVTLRNTLLEQGDLEILARERKMRYLALFGKFYNDSQLIFKERDFHKLNVLIVDSDDITEISFTNGSPNLEKIIWSFKNIVSLSGIDKLPALKELELNGDSVPNEVEKDIKKLKSRLDYKHRDRPKKQEEEEEEREADGAARCPSLWKAKDWCWRN